MSLMTTLYLNKTDEEIIFISKNQEFYVSGLFKQTFQYIYMLVYFTFSAKEEKLCLKNLL